MAADVKELRVRERTEQLEATLSPQAVQSRLSRGRLRPEEPCPIRTAFQRDRDRIIYSNAFRRLKHKTQVFISPLGDHYVTRLTHTLEVSQIARTVSRALNLNEDLTEAISLGHDLGHTPFGHIGEDVLNELYHAGFRHYEQSLRTVDRLENSGRGLNLTWEVRDGILNHSKSHADILGPEWGKSGTVEGDVVKMADVVAYINHDIGDAIRAGIITESDLPVSATAVLGHRNSERINTMVSDIICSSWGVREGSDAALRLSTRILEPARVLHGFLFERVYRVASAREEADRAREVVRRLYGYFRAHRDRLPAEYLSSHEDTERGIVDYIAGMTDQYALRLAGEIG